jgi:uncharacterized protein YecE (DUF72 family)
MTGDSTSHTVPKLGDIRIGISGWRYKPWRGVFYPKGLTQKRELAFAAEQFRSIEINGTFYSLQIPSSFERWAAETPDDFVFAVKGPRYITHMLKLKNVDDALANFFASGIFRLGKKLGPILWQLPPSFAFNPPRLESFFKLLPHDTEKTAAIARRHEKWLAKRRTDTAPRAHTKIRHALEIRHPSFLVKEFVDLLRNYNVALVCADTVEWPRRMDITSDFVYVRLHGSEVLYASGYGDNDLDVWAGRVIAWAAGSQPTDDESGWITARAPRKRAMRDVYVYFDNDAKVRAPIDAKNLIVRVAKLNGKDDFPN